MKPTMTAHEKNVSIDYWLLLDRFHALREQHLILSEQYEGWKQNLLPSQVRFQLLERNQQVCQQFKKQLHQFKKDLQSYRDDPGMGKVTSLHSVKKRDRSEAR